MALEPTQTLTEMSTRNLPGGKERPARKTDLTALLSTLSRRRESLNLSRHYEPPRPVCYTDGFTILPLEMQQISCEARNNFF
jgi:hypothetical protein